MAGCKSPRLGFPRGEGEIFFLDILFNRMSVIGVYRQLRLNADAPLAYQAAGDCSWVQQKLWRTPLMKGSAGIFQGEHENVSLYD